MAAVNPRPPASPAAAEGSPTSPMLYSYAQGAVGHLYLSVQVGANVHQFASWYLGTYWCLLAGLVFGAAVIDEGFRECIGRVDVDPTFTSSLTSSSRRPTPLYISVLVGQSGLP